MIVDIPEPYTQQGSSFQPNEAAGSCMLYEYARPTACPARPSIELPDPSSLGSCTFLQRE